MRCVAVEYSVQQFIYRFMAQILSMAQIMSTTGILKSFGRKSFLVVTGAQNFLAETLK